MQILFLCVCWKNNQNFLKFGRIPLRSGRSKCHVFLQFKKGFFSFISVFLKTIFFCKMWKMSIQYAVLGFEPMTSIARVSSHNHLTRAHSTISAIGTSSVKLLFVQLSLYLWVRHWSWFNALTISSFIRYKSNGPWLCHKQILGLQCYAEMLHSNSLKLVTWRATSN